jgi:hypothetical protein
MSKLLRNRWLRWAIVASALVGLGYGIYKVHPPEPLWVSHARPLCFTDGGRGVVTVPYSIEKNIPKAALGIMGFTPGPLQIWDARKGTMIARHLLDKQELHAYVVSNNGRYFAAEVATVAVDSVTIESLIVLDLISGAARELPLRDTATDGTLHFSPGGDYLVRLSDRDLRSLRIYEVATGGTARRADQRWNGVDHG